MEESVVAFCEVVLQAVIAEYQEDGDNNECLLEMLELALHYHVVLEQHLGTQSTLLIAVIQQLLASVSSERDLQNNQATQRGRPDCGDKLKDYFC